MSIRRKDVIMRPPPAGGGDILCSVDAHNNQNAKSIGNNTYATYQVLANGGTVVSQSVTITQNCLLVIVAVVTKWYEWTAWNIERGGVDKTQGRQQSALDGGQLGTLLLWATERITTAGTYTYSLVNRTGQEQYWTATNIKIYAIKN